MVRMWVGAALLCALVAPVTARAQEETELRSEDSVVPRDEVLGDLPSQAREWDRSMLAGVVVGNIGAVVAINWGASIPSSPLFSYGFLGVGPGGHHQQMVGHFVATDALIRSRVALAARGVDISKEYEGWGLGLTLGGLGLAWTGMTVGLLLPTIDQSFQPGDGVYYLGPPLGMAGILVSALATIPLEIGRRRTRRAWRRLEGTPEATGALAPWVRLDLVTSTLGLGVGGTF